MSSLKTIVLFLFLTLLAAAAEGKLSASKRDILSGTVDDVSLKRFDRTLDARAPQPIARPESNADRLKRGLAPRRPDRLHVPGKRLQARQSASPSSGPTCTPQTGTISVTFEESTAFLSRNEQSAGQYVWKSKTNQALEVSFCNIDDEVFDILTSNGDSTYTFLGPEFVGSGAPYDISGSNYAWIAAISQTPPGQYPGSTSNALSSPGQSYVWSLDPNTNELIPGWVGSNGVYQPFQIYGSGYESFFIAGDIDAVIDQTQYDASVATFTFVPDI